MDAGRADDLARDYLDRLRQLEETLAALGAGGGFALFGHDPPRVTWYVDGTRRAVADAELVARLSRDTGLMTAGWALAGSPALARIPRTPGQPDELTVADDAEAWRFASLLADAAQSPFLYRIGPDDAPVVHFLAVSNIRAPDPPQASSSREHSEALGPGFGHFLAAIGLVALALALGLFGYGMSSNSSQHGHPLAGLGVLWGELAKLAAVPVLLFGLFVGSVGYRREKQAALPPSTGTSEKAPAGQSPYRRAEVTIPPPRRASAGLAVVRRLGVCSFAATLPPWLIALVGPQRESLLVLFSAIAAMLWIVAAVMGSLAWARLHAYSDPSELRDGRHAKGWVIAGMLSLGLLFVLFWDVLTIGPTPAGR
ncbi:hypothetical protein [Nannocystis sp. SCPEA4]|uniref:hypothetical protein n=1 Tax=Nannocystis sp. SCPEA4 TaxID=2996787 RepID=UPI0022711A03|nr:hypothetical protein [Nannocystis sp. SCPEA4]MCY1054626.1 hypothetical protein [Nannocystis sp. SCPEA4]